MMMTEYKLAYEFPLMARANPLADPFAEIGKVRFVVAGFKDRKGVGIKVGRYSISSVYGKRKLLLTHVYRPETGAWWRKWPMGAEAYAALGLLPDAMANLEHLITSGKWEDLPTVPQLERP